MAGGPDTQHGEYVHGHMDIAQNEKTYRAFMTACKWVSLHTLSLLLLFTLWFCVDGVGFLGAFVATAIFVALGIWFVRFFFPPPHKAAH